MKAIKFYEKHAPYVWAASSAICITVALVILK